jgi:glycosyltransferase involved in cell wall biosynthesis
MPIVSIILDKRSVDLSILMLSNIYKPISTGSTNQIAGLAAEVSLRGHRVHVMTSKIESDLPSQEFKAGVWINRIPCFRFPRLQIAMNFAWLNWLTTPKNFRKVSNYIVENEIEIIHVHNHMFDAMLLGILVSRKTKVPICLTLHTVMQHNTKIYNVLLATIDRFVLKPLVSREIDVVIAPDYNMIKYAEKKLGVKSLALIPYGVDKPISIPESEIDRFILNKSLSGRRVIISVGHVNHLRNRIDLVHAISHVVKKDQSVLLVVIGDIADKRAYELVLQLGLSSNVLFTGIGTKEEIAIWRQIAILEAQWLNQAPDGSNSLGVASMEGMMSGNAVLSVANVDTFGPGTLSNFSNVIIFKPDSGVRLEDLLLELIQSPIALNSIGEQAKDYAQKNFSWHENADKHIDLYSSLKMVNKK